MSEAVGTASRSGNDDYRVTAEHVVSLLFMRGDREGVLDRYFALRALCSKMVWRQALSALLQERS